MTLDDDLRARAAAGPLSLHDFMAAANAHYYATRDPLGADGDFTTAPEISQMFGELVGVWLADLWLRAGTPSLAYVELGPGRGTLAADALRAARKLGLDPPVHLVETSPALRSVQADRVPHAVWHEDIATLPSDAPLLIIANEFFDALPIRQYVATEDGWRERGVEWSDNAWRWTFLPSSRGAEGDVAIHLPTSSQVEPSGDGLLRFARNDDIWEMNESAQAIITDLAARLSTQGGAMLVIDYGHAEPALGDTLQAVRGHAYADPLAAPGEADLTDHVDFSALARAASPLAVHGPVPQGSFLRAMGIGLRTSRLMAASPARAEEIAAARDRLISPDQMGALFKAMAVTAPGWPEPAGFA